MMPFQQSNSNILSHRSYDLPNHGFLTRFIVLVKIPSYKMVLNQKTLSHPHNIHATIAPIAKSCQLSHYRSIKSSQLGKTTNYISPKLPVQHLLVLWKLTRREEVSSSILASFLHVLGPVLYLLTIMFWWVTQNNNSNTYCFARSLGIIRSTV